jgi:hypothetical protein
VFIIYIKLRRHFCFSIVGTRSTCQSMNPNFPSSISVCRICGDAARYINYGTLTCSSCKIFFRRHGFHQQVRVFDVTLLFVVLQCSSVELHVYAWWSLSNYPNESTILRCMPFREMFNGWNELRSNSQRGSSSEKACDDHGPIDSSNSS